MGVGLISKSETNPNKFTLGKNIGISKFLNRILGMQVDLQNRLFQYFTDTLDFIVNEAKKSDHFDRGIGDLQCQREPEKKAITFTIRLPTGTAKTLLQTFHVDCGMSWETAREKSSVLIGAQEGFYKSKKVS